MKIRNKILTMMGGLIALGMLSASVARADTVTSLTTPSQITGKRLAACAGNSFNTDDSINGACRWVYSGACSRGCTPTTTTYYYVVTWDSGGGWLTSVYCGSVQNHQPNLNTWTYAPGFTSCPRVGFSEPIVVIINGTPYYYVTTSADGGFELVNTQATTLIVTF